MNNVIWLIFDSTRYDTFIAAKTPVLDKIGVTERRWSYASWTAPSHYVFLMGVPPHKNMRNVFASTQYRDEIIHWKKRLGLKDQQEVNLSLLAPSLSLPAFLKTLGYRCEAYVSLPVLNPHTLISGHFDHFELMPSSNNLESIVSKLHFSEEPTFFLINTGETHYPYLLPNETLSDLPRLPGLHGVYRSLDEFLRNPSTFLSEESSNKVFTPERLRLLWEKQVVCVEYLDGVINSLLEIAPKNTWFIVTSDHGELFGEDNFFGHGPIVHEKVYEVFFLEGQHP